MKRVSVMREDNCSDPTWESLKFRSLATWPFGQWPIQFDIKENIKARHYCQLVTDILYSQRVYEKCFHVTTSLGVTWAIHSSIPADQSQVTGENREHNLSRWEVAVDKNVLVFHKYAFHLTIYSLSRRIPYHKISWSLEVMRFGFKPFWSLWNLAS